MFGIGPILEECGRSALSTGSNLSYFGVGHMQTRQCLPRIRGTTKKGVEALQQRFETTAIRPFAFSLNQAEAQE